MRCRFTFSRNGLRLNDDNCIPGSKVRERGHDCNERGIVKAARELGFSIVYPHNKAHIRVDSEQQLREIGKRAGVDDLV